MSCVTTIEVTGSRSPRSRAAVRRISSLITSLITGSRPVVGSSYSITSGSSASARARPTRFFCPPDSPDGLRCVTCSGNPTCRISPATCPASRSSSGAPSCRGPNATFSKTLSESNRAAPWKRYPNRARRRANSAGGSP